MTFGKKTMVEEGKQQAGKAMEAVAERIEAVADSALVEDAMKRSRSNWKTILVILVTLGLLAAIIKKATSDDNRAG